MSAREERALRRAGMSATSAYRKLGLAADQLPPGDPDRAALVALQEDIDRVIDRLAARVLALPGVEPEPEEPPAN